MLKMFNMTSHKPSHIPLENMETMLVNGAPELLYSAPDSPLFINGELISHAMASASFDLK